MTIKELEKTVKYNSIVFGAPKLINKNDLPKFFEIENNNIVKDAVSYFFINEPKIWHQPAKNYFVRICLAWYLTKDSTAPTKLNMSFREALNAEEILPYDDAYTSIYDKNKEVYEKIIEEVFYHHGELNKLPGYLKTIEVFGYLYKPLIKNKQITIGYNATGQDFFDTICPKKRFIHEYFFSLFHTMRKKPLQKKEILNSLSSSNTYGIPGNLLLNTEAEEEDALFTVNEVIRRISNIKAVTVLHYSAAKKIKEAFPELQIHISTHGAQELELEQINPEIIYCVNINEPFIYTEKQQEIIKKCRANNIKIKHIVNRGCVCNKWENMRKLSGNNEIMCCNNYQCKQLKKTIPWIDFIRINMQKEMLKYYNPDFLKISTRDNSNDEVTKLLKYWTTPEVTEKVYDIKLNENNFGIYMEWVKYRCTECDGQCPTCMKCKNFYEKMKEGVL